MTADILVAPRPGILALRARGLSKRFGALHVTRDVDLSLPRLVVTLASMGVLLYGLVWDAQ